MPVPIADEYIEEPRGEQRPCVDTLVGMLLEACDELLRAQHARGTGKTCLAAVIAFLGRPQLEPAEHAAELRTVFAE